MEYVQILYEVSVHVPRTIPRLQWTPPCPWQELEREGLKSSFHPKSCHEMMIYDIKFNSLSLSQPQIMRKKMIFSSGELFLLLSLSLLPTLPTLVRGS